MAFKTTWLRRISFLLIKSQWGPLLTEFYNTADGYKRAMKKPDVDQCADQCYLKYFGNGFVPTGLDLSNSAERSCICQQDDNGKDCFATYFYDDAGIAAYSAYTIQASDATNIGTHKRPQVSWKTTPGWWRLIYTIDSYSDNNQSYLPVELNPAMVTYAVNTRYICYTQYWDTIRIFFFLFFFHFIDLRKF